MDFINLPTEALAERKQKKTNYKMIINPSFALLNLLLKFLEKNCGMV